MGGRFVRLLLVEDNRRLQQTLRHSLVEAGYAVDVADNGEDGKLLGEVTAYDVMVLDVMLQEVTAWRSAASSGSAASARRS
jgi:DNA-binding response OmpR family regulator